MSSFWGTTKKAKKKTLTYYKNQIKKAQAKLDIKEAKKKLESMKQKL